MLSLGVKYISSKGVTHSAIAVFQANIMKALVGLADVHVYADLTGFACPTSITRLLKRPDLILVHKQGNAIVVEVMFGCITEVEEDSQRKQISHKETFQDLSTRYTNITFINPSMSALGKISENASGKEHLNCLNKYRSAKSSCCNKCNKISYQL